MSKESSPGKSTPNALRALMSPSAADAVGATPVAMLSPLAFRQRPRVAREMHVMRALFLATLLAGALAGSALALAPEPGCSLPSEPKGIPAALDAAISGPADKDRACMKALLVPEARIIFVSPGADGATSYTVLTLDDWIARTRSRGHAVLEEEQLRIDLQHYGNIAHLWSSYALRSDGKQAARGINSIQAIKTAGGWRLTDIMVQAESAAAPLPKKYLPPESDPGPALAEPTIGRTDVLHGRHEEALWPSPQRWLRPAALPEGPAGLLIRPNELQEIGRGF